MLKTIHLQNFKSHQDTKLQFDSSRLHTLVGQNGMGKTSILQAIDALCSLCNPNVSYGDIPIFQDQLDPSILSTLGKKDKDGQITLSVIATGNYYNKNEEWEAWYQWSNQMTNDHPDPVWKDDDGWHTSGEPTERLCNRPDTPIVDELGSAIYLKLIAGNLAQADYSDDIAPRMNTDGTGLAPLMDYIRNESPDTFREIETMLQQIVPSVKRVRIKRAKVPINRQRTIEIDNRTISYEDMQKVMGQEIIFDVGSGEGIPAYAMGEGTILTLGLLATLMSPTRPKLILLDDIEQGLHPKAQIGLVQLLKKIIEMNPDLQIIFTTHSPYILDELEPSQVHVLHQGHDGYTVAKRLDEHTTSTWAKGVLTTGEFWDAEGEEWVLEANEQGVAVDG